MLILIDQNGTQEQDKQLIAKLHEVFGGLVVFKSEQEAAAYLEKKAGGGARRLEVVAGAGNGHVGNGNGSASNVVPIASATPASFTRGLPDLVDELESRMVHEAMTRTGNNQVRAAELLKITRGALQYKLKKYVKKEAA